MTATLDRCFFEREPEAFRLSVTRRAKNRPGVGHTSDDDPARARYIEKALARRRGNESETDLEKEETNA